jgi:hypothetical protein
MKIFFFLLILFHALIHLLGFLKGFQILELKEFTLSISKSMGLIWLGASKCNATWKLENEDWTWAEFEVTQVEFNPDIKL